MKKNKLLLLAIMICGLPACSGLQVMVETDRPEDDFLIVCGWSSKYFTLHGGKSQIKENVFVASSGELIDCGTSWRGDGPIVHVSHPLYMRTIGGEHAEGYRAEHMRMEDGVVIITPLSKQLYLDNLIRDVKGEGLVRRARKLSGNYPDQYLGQYKSVKKVDAKRFKKAYEERLTEYWETLLPVIQGSFSNPTIRNSTVKDFVNVYWERAKGYE